MLRTRRTPIPATRKSRITAKRIVKLDSCKSFGPSIKLLHRTFYTSAVKRDSPTEPNLRALIESLQKIQSGHTTSIELIQKSQSQFNARLDALQTDLNKLAAQLTQYTSVTNQLVKTNDNISKTDAFSEICAGILMGICLVSILGFLASLEVFFK
jgi:uncharacterized phage infection (PIP) family protein YhgE